MCGFLQQNRDIIRGRRGTSRSFRYELELFVRCQVVVIVVTFKITQHGRQYTKSFVEAKVKGKKREGKKKNSLFSSHFGRLVKKANATVFDSDIIAKTLFKSRMKSEILYSCHPVAQLGAAAQPLLSFGFLRNLRQQLERNKREREIVTTTVFFFCKNFKRTIEKKRCNCWILFYFSV